MRGSCWERSCNWGQEVQGLEGMDFYLALVAASMIGVRLFGVGEKGVALAFCTAAL